MVLTGKQKKKIVDGVLEAYKIGTEVGLTNDTREDTRRLIYIAVEIMVHLERID